MARSWLLRPSPNGDPHFTDFEKYSIVGIGWRETDFSGKSREQLKDILSKSPYNLTSLELGNAYATVDIFVNQMKQDDLILIPNGEDIYFCVITSDYYYNSTFHDAGFPSQRKVKFLRHVQRNDLPMNLRKSLKVHRTTADLNKHHETISALAYGNPIPGELLEDSNTSLINVSYPIRHDLSITISIPRDITQKESERLGDFIKTLHFD